MHLHAFADRQNLVRTHRWSLRQRGHHGRRRRRWCTEQNTHNPLAAIYGRGTVCHGRQGEDCAFTEQTTPIVFTEDDTAELRTANVRQTVMQREAFIRK